MRSKSLFPFSTNNGQVFPDREKRNLYEIVRLRGMKFNSIRKSCRPAVIISPKGPVDRSFSVPGSSRRLDLGPFWDHNQAISLVRCTSRSRPAPIALESPGVLTADGCPDVPTPTNQPTNQLRGSRNSLSHPLTHTHSPTQAAQHFRKPHTPNPTQPTYQDTV